MSSPDVGINVFRERVFPILFMLIVTAFFIAIVSGIYLARTGVCKLLPVLCSLYPQLLSGNK